MQLVGCLRGDDDQLVDVVVVVVSRWEITDRSAVQPAAPANRCYPSASGELENYHWSAPETCGGAILASSLDHLLLVFFCFQFELLAKHIKYV